MKVHAWVALAVGMIAFAAYVFAAAPAPYPLDSAELATAAFGLGVAHPPGEGTTLLLAKAFTLLPLGTVAFKVALSQAAFGALAAVLVFLLVLDMIDSVAVEKIGAIGRLSVAAATALAFAFAKGVVAVSDRPEVYATQTALSLAGLWLALRARRQNDPRLALLAALTIGLGVGNHSLVAGLVALGAIAATWPLLQTSTVRGRFVALAVVAFSVGMLVHAYLPLRTHALFASADHAADNVLWGDARTAHGFAWLVSARTFAEKAGIVHGHASPWDLPFLFIEELEMVFALLAPAGLYFLVRRSSSRLVGIAVAVGAAGSMVAALIGGLDPNNPDIRGYLGPAIALVAVMSAAAVATVLAFVRSTKLRTGLAVLFAFAALSRFPSTAHYPGLRYAAAADYEAGAMLDDVPAHGALLTSHFETGFLVGYRRFVEGARPDVAWAHLAFARGPGYAERLAAASPELAAVLAARDDRSFMAALRTLHETRPVRIEPGVIISPKLRRHLGPSGQLWSVSTETSALAVAPLPMWIVDEASSDNQVKAFLAWRNYSDAAWSCELGLHQRAAERFANLQRLVPEDRRFAELRAECR